MRIKRIINDNKTKDEQYSSSSKRPKMGSGWTGRDAVTKNGQWLDGKRCSGWVLDF